MPVRHSRSGDNFHAIKTMGETPMPPYGPTMGGTPKALGLIRTWV